MRHANTEHKEHLTRNEKIGVWVTTHVGTMTCAYIFAGIGIGSLVGIFTNNTFLGLGFGAVSSYFIQLVLLPVIMVGNNVQSRHSEIRADIQYETDLNTEMMVIRIEERIKNLQLTLNRMEKKRVAKKK